LGFHKIAYGTASILLAIAHPETDRPGFIDALLCKLYMGQVSAVFFYDFFHEILRDLL